MKILSKEIIDSLFANVNGEIFNIQEGQFVEFKLSFSITDRHEYFRVFAGLSNHKGGYVIFGIEPTNKKLQGLEEKSICQYSQIDDERFRGELKSCFEPNISYEYNQHEFAGKKFIVFLISESNNKPIVCRANGGSVFKEGDIFYKYNDSVKKVAYSELSGLLEEKRLKEQKKWMDFFAKISKVGLDHLVLIDGENGKIITPSDNSIILDSSFVEKLNYIKEGEFNEVVGAPTIKLIATLDLNTQSSTTTPQAILAKDIFCNMLLGKADISPLEFIKQSCDLQGKFPIFYYIKLSGKSNRDIISIINSVQTTKGRYKEKIIRRINGNDRIESIIIDPEGKFDPLTDAMKSNRRLKARFLKKGAKSYNLKTKDEIEEFCKAIRTLTKDEIIPIKNEIFNKLYNYIQVICFGEDISGIPSPIKNAIWYMDEKLYS